MCAISSSFLLLLSLPLLAGPDLLVTSFVCIWNILTAPYGEGNGNPLQYSCLANPMDGGAWWAAVHGVARSRTRLSDFTLFFHFHALEKEMATHSRVLAWRIPGTGEPGGLPSMGSCGVGHDWSYLAAAAVAATAPYIVCLWVSLHTVVDVSWRCSSYSRISVCVHLVDTLYSVSHISLLKMSLHHFFPLGLQLLNKLLNSLCCPPENKQK